MTKQAYVIIHGVGDFKAGNALRKTLEAISERYPEVSQSEERSIGGASFRYHDVTVGEDHVRVGEFHWSGAFGKLRRFNPFRTFWYVFGLFSLLPGLGAHGSTNAAQSRLARYGGLLLKALSIALTLAVIWLFSSLYFDVGRNPDETTLGDTPVVGAILFGLPALITIGTLGWALLGYLFSRWREDRRTGRTAQWLGLLVGSTLLLAYAFTIGILAIPVTVLFLLGGEPTDVIAGAVVGIAIVSAITWPILGIVDLLRDVVTYLAPSADNQDNPTTASIKKRVVKVLDQLVAEKYERFTLVSHSLGTVIAAETLLQWNTSHDLRPRVRLVTCGSPLRRLIARLLPNRRLDPQSLFDRLAGSRQFEFAGWLNVYRVADPIGKRLFAKPDDITPTNRAGPNRKDHLLRPWYIPPYGHSNYWSGREVYCRCCERNDRFGCRQCCIVIQLIIKD